MQGAVDLGEFGLKCLDLGLSKVLLQGGLVLRLLVLTDAGQPLRALEEQALLLYGLTQGDPSGLELGPQGLGVANGAL